MRLLSRFPNKYQRAYEQIIVPTLSQGRPDGNSSYVSNVQPHTIPDVSLLL